MSSLPSNWLVQSHERDDQEVTTRKKNISGEVVTLVTFKVTYLANRIDPPQIWLMSFTDTCTAVL